MGGFLGRVRAEVDAWCAGRRWWLRAPGLVFFLWVWMRHAGDPLYRSPFAGLNLGVHELGHFVFGPFGDLPGALGGSIAQCLLPLVGMAMFARQRDWFAVAFAWGWLSTNLFEVATYAADAVAMRLPLVTPGGAHATHDWNYVLGATGRLRHTEEIAGLIRLGAHAGMLACVVGIGWVCSRMLTLSGKPEGGGLAARPRDTSLRPRSEPDPPGISAPVSSASPSTSPALPKRVGSPESDGPVREAEREAPGRVLDR